MAITNGYCTLAEMKAELGLSDSADDSLLEISIESASRMIDNETGRFFYSSSVTKYYTAERTNELLTDDIISITTLKTDDNDDGTFETTWATSDYRLFPLNESPKNKIRLKSSGTKIFPLSDAGVEIVGTFGFSAVPMEIKKACMIQALRLFKRKDAPFGIIGMVGTGMVGIQKLDHDVKNIIMPYVRIVMV